MFDQIKQQLQAVSSNERRQKALRYFKSEHVGQDIFIGVTVPDLRIIAKQHVDVPMTTVRQLLVSTIHEYRMCALLIVVGKMNAAVKRRDENAQTRLFRFYLAHKRHIDNWDLVDLSTHYVVGRYVLLHPASSTVLYELAASDVLWDRRIAMVANWLIIRQGQLDHTLALAEILIDDEQDLMHKAVGWMLREAWKRDPARIEAFLIEFWPRLARTTLRYAIEKMPEAQRRSFLVGDFKPPTRVRSGK